MIGEPKVTLDRAIEERDQAKAMLEGVEAQRDAWLVKSLQTEEKLQKAIEERNEARDCGQPGCCAIPPGCQRCWAIRNGELSAQIADTALTCAWHIEREKALLARLESAEGDFAAMRKYLGYESMHITGAACRVAMERDSANAQIKALKDQLAMERVSADEVALSLAKAVVDRDALGANLVAMTDLLNEMNEAALSVVAERDSLRAEVEQCRRMTTYQRAVAIHEACGARGDEEPEDAVKRIIAERDEALRQCEILKSCADEIISIREYLGAMPEADTFGLVKSVVDVKNKEIKELEEASKRRTHELICAERAALIYARSPWVVFGVEPTIVSGAMLFETPLWFLEIATRGEFTFKVKNTDTVFKHKFDRVHLLDGPEWFEGAVRAFMRVHRTAFADVFKAVQGDNIRIGND